MDCARCWRLTSNNLFNPLSLSCLHCALGAYEARVHVRLGCPERRARPEGALTASTAVSRHSVGPPAERPAAQLRPRPRLPPSAAPCTCLRILMLHGDASSPNGPLWSGICVWPGTWLSLLTPQPTAGPVDTPGCLAPLTALSPELFIAVSLGVPFSAQSAFYPQPPPPPRLTTALGGRHPSLLPQILYCPPHSTWPCDREWILMCVSAPTQLLTASPRRGFLKG